jgi:hypothetical protein
MPHHQREKEVMKSFHQRYPTSIAHELWLADRLVDAILMRHGSLPARRRLRADAGGVFGRLRYHRVPQEPLRGRPWAVVFVGTEYRSERESRATTAEILTPDKAGPWLSLQIALEGRCGTMFSHEPHDRTKAAKAIRRMGYAVAESLATAWFFNGESSWAIAEDVSQTWHQRDQKTLHRFPEDSFDRLHKRRRVAVA